MSIDAPCRNVISIVMVFGRFMSAALERPSMVQGIIIFFNNGCGGFVFGIRRFAPLFAIVTAMLVFLPQQGLALESDPYQNSNLHGGVNFIYTNGKNTTTDKTSGASNDTQDNYNGFRQIYNLDMMGKLLSRRLIIYDAGVSYTKDAVRSVYSESASRGKKTTSLRKNNITDYHFSTTIIPKSAIPLMLYGSHITEDNIEIKKTRNTTRTYGLDWNFRLKTLPEVHIAHDNAKTTGVSGNSSSQRSNVSVKKDIGITKNSASLSKASSRASYGYERSSTAIGFTNATRFSKRTQMDANLAKNSIASSKTAEFGATALDMHLISTPGTDFSQRHSYVYRLIRGESASENSMYSGYLMYRLTDRLSTVMSLRSRSDVSRNPSGQLRTNSMDMSDTIRYRLTRRLIWRVDGVYAHERSDAPNADARGLNWTRYKLTTGLDYKRIFKPFSVAMSGKGGYVVENTGAKTSKTYKKRRGLTYGASMGLSRINLFKYAVLHTSYGFTQAKDELRNTMTDIRTYGAGISNIIAKKYVSAKANYANLTINSWFFARDQRKETYDGQIKTNARYFKNSTATLTAKRVKAYAWEAGKTISDNMTAVGKTKRESSLGETTADINLSRNKYSVLESNSIVSSSLYTLHVAQKLLFFDATRLGLNIKRFRNSTNSELAEVSNDVTVDMDHRRSLIGGQFTANYSFTMTKRQYMAEQDDAKIHLFASKFKKDIYGVNSTASYSFNAKSGTFRELEEKYTVHAAEIALNKQFSRNLSVELFGSLSRASGTFAYVEVPSVTEFRSTIRYMLRRWTISAEYSDKVSDYVQQTITDNRFMLSLSRDILRVW